MLVSSRATALSVAAVAGSLLVACSSSGSATNSGVSGTPTASATTAASSPAPDGSSASAPGDSALSKEQFVAQTNAVCASVYEAVKKLPTPSGPTDYSAIIAYGQGSLNLYPTFQQQVKALVARSADKGELTAKWVALDDADFAAQVPLVRQMVEAAKAKDDAKAQQLAQSLSEAPDHSSAEASFLNGYGLTDCARLESA